MTSLHSAGPVHHPFWLITVSLFVMVTTFVMSIPDRLLHAVPAGVAPADTLGETIAPPATVAPQSALIPSTTPSPTPATQALSPTATSQPPAAATSAVTLPVLVGPVKPAPPLSDDSPPYGPSVLPAPGSSGPVALTFDCGYDAASLSGILATLAEHDAQATFFFEGRWVSRTPAVVAMAAGAGHELGSHSYSHTDFATLTEEEVAWELESSSALVAQAGGPARLTLFRYPGGARTAETDGWLVARGYRIVGWSIDPKGWEAGTTPEDVIAHVRTNAKPGGIILMHCGCTTDETALDQVIRELLFDGYALVTVSALAGE